MFWKKDRNIVVALEVGSSKVVAAVAELREDGSLVILGVGESQSHQVRKCEIIDFEIAQKCVHDAINDAEEKTDVTINEVYLAISGAHIRSANAQLTTYIATEGHEIMPEHLEELASMARQQPLHSGYALIHDLIQHYRLDDGSVTENPVGLSSKRLQAEYHLVSGINTRLQTTIRCVRELSVDVRNYALSIYATAQAVLTPEEKQEGAVVINCGAGVTDYLVYQNGSVVHSGVLGVGGDHLTNDLVAGLKLPFVKAEQLKREHGSVHEESMDGDLGGSVVIPGSYSFEERAVRRQAVLTIMQARQAELLQIIRDDLEAQPFWPDFAGSIHFTGGAAQVRGLIELASEIFSCPVNLAGGCPLEGDQGYASRPELSTVLGLLHYARVVEEEIPSPGAWGRMRQKVGKALAALGLF
ncbi:MAG: cell division protein FtsA [Verrucomicrobium sp.]|nr:cell division protein FtsA [Verrucomicrobium sp.]